MRKKSSISNNYKTEEMIKKISKTIELLNQNNSNVGYIKSPKDKVLTPNILKSRKEVLGLIAKLEK